MADDALKAAAQKELLRRAAQAELSRREAAKGAAPSKGADSWADTAFRMTPLGVAKDLYGAATDPMGALQKVDDSVRTLANGMSFGFADKLAGKMNATGTEAERNRSTAAKERLGTTGDAIEMLGMMAPTSRLAQMGVTATRLPGAVGKYGGLLLDGAAIGALDAAGHDRPVMEGAGVGGLLGAAGGLVGKGVEKVYNKVAAGPAYKQMREAAPSFEQVANKKNAIYSALDEGGIKFDADEYERMLSDTSAALKNFRATKAPMTADTVNYMAQFRGQSPTFRDVEDVLQEAKGILREKSATDADKAAASVLVDKLSKFFDDAPLITNGTIPAGEVAGMVKNARELSRRHILAKDVMKMKDKSEWYTSGDESGLRNQFAAYGKAKGKGLTSAEKAAAQAVIRREGLLSTLNQTGTKLGQIVLGTTGFSLGGLPGLAAATGGHLAARKASEKITEKAVNDYIKTVLAGRGAQKAAANRASLLQLQPEQMKALQAALRAGSVGLLGAAAQ